MSLPKAVMVITVNVHGTGPERVDTPEVALHGKLAHGRYTYRAGLPRLLDMLRHHDIAATFFWPTFEAEQAPALLARCLAEGHEVASQGLAFEDLAQLGDRERAVLQQARDRLAALTGTLPRGFRQTSSGFSAYTLSILRDLGYQYDSSGFDDDRPYALTAEGCHGMIELPWSEGLNDSYYFGRRVTQDRAYAHMAEQAEALLAADGYACLTLHPRADLGVGRAARLQMVERLLCHLHSKFQLRFATCASVASQIIDTSTSAGNLELPL